MMNRIITLITLAFAAPLWASSVTPPAGGRMYFVCIVEENPLLQQKVVVLGWNPLEKKLPDAITGFRLYRREPPADFSLLAETSRALPTLQELEALLMEPGEELRFQDIEQWAINDSGGTVMGMDAIPYLHAKLSLGPGDPDYDPVQVFLLSRYSINVSRALGLAHIDRAISSDTTYEYMLTGLVGPEETLPLGKVTIDTSEETILPAPTGFEQSFIQECAAIQGGIDDQRVHLKWDISPAPEALPQKILTFGYDVFRSESDMGPLDLRTLRNTASIPGGLIHIAEDQPIIAPGPAPDSGLDNYLAIDEGDPFEFDFLQRGRTYFYYLAAKDLSGNYSETTGPLMAQVPDRLPPPVPWNFRAEEVKDEGDPSIPRMQLVWSDITPSNYWEKYRNNRQLVDPPEYAAPMELYWVPNSEPAVPRNHRVVDLSVVVYRLFRFATQEEAQQWGSDSDGDLWPDNIEEDAGTDPCDDASLPGATPPQLIAEIDFTDTSSLRTLSNGVEQRVFVDDFVQPDNHVYWYRILAVDDFGNQSPLSPPVRAFLPDRDQPDVDAGIFQEHCQYSVVHNPQCTFEPGIRFRLTDNTSDELTADGGFARLYELCGEVPSVTGERIFIAQKPFVDREAVFEISDFTSTNCQSLCGRGPTATYAVGWHSRSGQLIFFDDTDQTILCESARTDCFELEEDCRRREVGPGGVIDPDMDGEVCFNLLAGQRARIFFQINGEMTPYRTILTDHEEGVEEYCEPIDLKGIVPSNTCLGARVFSENNVGSSVIYLGCVGLGEESGNGPQTPLMHSVVPTGTEENPTFTVTWAAQAEGLSAFVLAYKSGADIRYETFWVPALEPLDEPGRYRVVLPFDTADLNKEWCFEVRAIDKILQSSGWSQPMCDVWEPEAGPFLGWPPVPDVPEGEGITAVWLNFAANPQPLLILSGDLESELGDRECQTDGLSECGTGLITCLGPTTFRCPGICSVIESANRYGRFIVYRQEIGKDFVQVSPLIDSIYCWRSDLPEGPGKVEGLDDPFIYLMEPDENILFPTELRPDADGKRLVFADSYPVRIGSVIRYCVLQVDPNTGEGIAMHYSEPLQVP